MSSPNMATDWPSVLADIATTLDSSREVGTRRLSASLRLSRSTVRNWLAGAEPGHADGEMLIRAWIAATGKTRDDLPQERAPLSASRANRMQTA